MTVTAPAYTAPAEVKNSGFLVAPREVLKSAGALQDVSRYVQSLPGVVIGTNDFRNDIIVRGGSPLENLFIVDNIEIPNINSFANFASAGGTVSILDAELLQDVTFLTGGYPAPYINRTSSVLQVTQREGNRQEFGGWATLGFAGAGAILEGPIAGGKGSWIVSGRRSFLDFFTDDVGFGGVPVLYTLNAKAVYDLTPRDRLWVVNVSGKDNIRLGYQDDVEPEDELSTLDIRYQGWRSATGFNWQRLFGARGVGLLGVTHSEAKVGQRVKDLAADGVPPTGPADEAIAASPTVYFEDSREGRNHDQVRPHSERALSGQDPDGRQLQGLPRRLRRDLALWQRHALLAGAGRGSVLPEHRLPLLPDGRLPAGDEGDDQPCQHDGRPAGGRLRLPGRDAAQPAAGSDREAWRRTVSWNASYGRYFQQPAFLFLSAFPENRDVVPWRADHFVTGVAWVPSTDLRATVEVYGKKYRDYPVAATLPSVSLANIGDTFDVREILFPLTSAGRGDAYGVELFVEKRLTSKIYGQTNLAFSRTRHAALDGILRPGSFDYPFVFNVTGGYRLTPKWEISTRVAALGGRPYTPYDEAVSAAQYRGVYDLTRVNGERGPDLRAHRRAGGPDVHGGRPAAQSVLRRAEPDEPPQLRRLCLESPDQCARRQRAAGAVSDHRVRLEVLKGRTLARGERRASARWGALSYGGRRRRHYCSARSGAPIVPTHRRLRPSASAPIRARRESGR